MENSELKKKHCVPCEGGTAPLTTDEEEKYLSAVPEWSLDRSAVHFIRRNFLCKNFVDALAFIQKIGELAESEGHHPNIYLHDYKQVEVTLFTHAIEGLSENDFIMAVKINELKAQ